VQQPFAQLAEIPASVLVAMLAAEIGHWTSKWEFTKGVNGINPLTYGISWDIMEYITNSMTLGN